jgi:galacturonosyltransferase
VSSPDSEFKKISEFTQKIKDLGCSYIDTYVDRRGANPLKDYALYREYRSLLREIKPDLALTYTIKPNIYGNFAANKSNIPVISTVTGVSGGFFRGGVISMAVKTLCRAAFRKTASVVFQNSEDEALMRRYKIIKGQRTLMVPGSGVNLKEYEVLDYPDTPVTSFIFVGRFMRAKGVIELIEAARRLGAEYPDSFTVTLVGFGESDINQEVERAEQEGIIINAGFKEDVIPFYRDSSCVIMPSYKEGMSNVLLEAAASGRPLIATDVSGCRETVDDGVNGFLCKPKDADSLYNCMKRFMSLPYETRAEMGRASRGKVEKSFSRDIVIATMIKEAENLAGVNK